jgi:hypothetical protein
MNATLLRQKPPRPVTIDLPNEEKSSRILLSLVLTRFKK